MKPFHIALKRCSGFANFSKVKLQLQLPKQSKLIRASVYLQDGEGYHIADKRWKSINKQNRCVSFRLQFTKIGKIELVGRCEVKYAYGKTEKSKFFSINSLWIQALPPFLSHYQRAENLALASLREGIIDKFNHTIDQQAIDSSKFVSWIWLSGLPIIGKTILLRQMQRSWSEKGAMVYWIDFASFKDNDLPAYVARGLGWNGSSSASITGEERLRLALEDTLNKARSKADISGEQRVIIIFDELDKVKSDHLSRFKDVIGVLRGFDGKGGLARDSRIYWRMIFSHRLPRLLPEKDREEYIALFAEGSSLPNETNEISIGLWDQEEIKKYLDKQRSDPPRLIYEYDLDYLAQKLWQVTGGYPVLINAYLQSAEKLYEVYLNCDAPLAIRQKINNQLTNPEAVPSEVKDRAKELADFLVSMLLPGQRQLLCKDMSGRHCSLANCLGKDQARCDRSYLQGLEVLESVGIWRTDTICPFGSPLLAVNLKPEE
jgi:hypothetical protein